MATKTIVCPECQAPAVPGRYACAHCGAVLASVALVGRASGGLVSEPAAGPPPAGPFVDHPSGEAMADDLPRAAPIAPAWTHALAAEPADEPLAEPGEDERWDDEAVVVDASANREMPDLRADAVPTDEPASAAAAVSQMEELAAAPATIAAVAPPAKAKSRSSARTPRAQRPLDPTAIDRIAPMAEPQSAAEPEPAAEPELAAEPDIAARVTPPAEEMPTAAPVAPVEPGPVANPGWVPPVVEWPATLIDERLTLAGVVARGGSQPAWPQPGESRPGWPPPGDPGVMIEPLARVPAGSYLPPTAVLPPGGAVAAASGTNGRIAAPISPPAAGHSTTESRRVSAAERLAQLGLPADTPRRVVGIGAVIAALGFLLPWAAVLAGSGLLGDYWTQWGMAGPGHWIVVTLLVGLAVLSLVDGRLATVSVGLPAVAIAALLVGLSWPYLFGFLGKAAGIWVVLFGAILLATGGLLDLRAGRHDEPNPTV